MLDYLKVFDTYSLRARLFPALLAAAPALAALALLISWRSLGLSNIVATLAVTVLLFALADFTRARGRAIEQRLFKRHGGKPSVILFRRIDATLEEGTKDRYRQLLGTKLGLAIPTPEEEAADLPRADSFYEQCGVWLRDHTRDTKKFPLLFAENITYGFRRNLLGVKWVALGLNVLVVVICLACLWYEQQVGGRDLQDPVTVVLVLAAAHALYVLTVVTRSAVWDAACAYGRELILSCETFIQAPGSPVPTPARPRRTAKAKKRPDEEAT